MIENQHPGLEPDLPALRRFARQAQRAAGLAAAPSVRLMSDRDIQVLNREFRGFDKPTDVLSFPGSRDLAISLDTALRQARVRRHTLAIEIRILMLHGMLHLAGYDHEADQGEMQHREQELRQKLGLPPGLIERAQRRKMK